MRYKSYKKDRELWLTQTRNLVWKHKKIDESVKLDADRFMDNVEEYLNGNDKVAGSQKCIGFK